MKKSFCILFLCLLSAAAMAQDIFSKAANPNSFALTNPVIYADKSEDALVHLSAELLQKDIKAVTGLTAQIVSSVPEKASTLIILGTVAKSSILELLETKKLVSLSSIRGQWEAYRLQTLNNPIKGISQAVVIAGSDRRGLAFGTFDFSKQLGVSPWYWWADVPVEKKNAVFIKKNLSITDAPKVKYRGIFINDEAPALSTWTKRKKRWF